MRGVAEAIHKDKADSSVKVDCHANFQSARNDKKEVDSSGSS
ncbi:hypothetical protein [Helicobacter canis]|nr:hypothetical protein [Helicobacter canis]